MRALRSGDLNPLCQALSGPPRENKFPDDKAETAIDKQVIANLADQGNLPCDGMSFTDALPEDWAALDRCRERDECWDKLVALGLTKEM